jgi:hypothetical protein
MWRSVLSNAENLWYFIHEMTEYGLLMGMSNVPRCFREATAQIMAYLIVKGIDPQGAVFMQQRYLTNGIASQAAARSDGFKR